MQSILQNVCQHILNFVPKVESWYIEIHKPVSNKIFHRIILIHGPIRSFAHKPVCEFQYQLLNCATNLRTSERNLECFGKSFVKSTV